MTLRHIDDKGRSVRGPGKRFARVRHAMRLRRLDNWTRAMHRGLWSAARARRDAESKRRYDRAAEHLGGARLI